MAQLLPNYDEPLALNSWIFPKSNKNTWRKKKRDDIKRKMIMTHSVEHCGADEFNYEVVIQTQFLQAVIEVIWTNKQTTAVNF